MRITCFCCSVLFSIYTQNKIMGSLPTTPPILPPPPHHPLPIVLLNKGNRRIVRAHSRGSEGRVAWGGGVVGRSTNTEKISILGRKALDFRDPGV